MVINSGGFELLFREYFPSVKGQARGFAKSADPPTLDLALLAPLEAAPAQVHAQDLATLELEVAAVESAVLAATATHSELPAPNLALPAVLAAPAELEAPAELVLTLGPHETW